MTINNSPSVKSKSSIKYRMLWHLSLTIIILALLFFISLLSYNEIINEKKLVGFFDELNETEKLLQNLDSTNLDYIRGQESLIKYLISNNKEDIKDYFASLHKVSNLMDTLQNKGNTIEIPKMKIDTISEDLDVSQKLSKMIDSLSQNIMQDAGKNIGFNRSVERLDYNDLDVKTTIETKSEVDSVKKKGMFGRLGDALKGKVGVQKEKTEVLMILEYGGNKTTGSIEEQMGSVIKMASDYYEKELKKINRNFALLTKKNQKLLTNTLSLQNLSDEVLRHYKTALMKQRDILSEKYSVQYSKNRMIRLNALFGIAALLIILTIAVLYLTNTTYKVEKKLIAAKEKLTDNLLLKNKIVSMISHDIRSPLNIILLYIKQALKLEKDPQKAAVFDSINYTTNSAFLLANRILDFSKDEDNQMTVYEDEFNLHDEIDHIVEGFNTLAKAKNNKLININQVESTAEVIFDRSKLQRLYFNLLDNAIKYTESGDIEVLSDCQEAENGMYKFTLSVKDSGKGIPEDSLKSIFEPFQQASGTELEKGDLGVGLGLYLCKEITELFGGNISIQSKIDEGTTVSAYVFLKNKK